MKRLMILFVLFSILIPASVSFALFEDVQLIVENGGEVALPAHTDILPEIIMEPGEEPVKGWRWTSSNTDVASFCSIDSFNTIGLGEATLTGEALGGSGATAKFKVTVPKVYTSADRITVTSPEGVVFSYIVNTNGYTYTDTTGDCFYTESMDNINGASTFRIVPVKVGTGSFYIENNGKRIKTVKIEVKKSALETASDTKSEAPIDGVVIATVKKGVNIRQEPNADSTKMGAAAQGDKLTVTHPFYTEKWHQIDFNGETCYVSANYCELSESAVPVSVPSAEPTKETEQTVIYIGNRNTKKLHYPSCSSIDDMKEKNKVEFTSKEAALDRGYQPCKRCKP